MSMPWGSRWENRLHSDILQAEGLFGLECGLRSTVPLHFCRFCRWSFSSRNDSNFNIYLMYFGMLSISLHTKAPPCFLQRRRWLCFFAQSDTRRDLDSKPQDVHVICRMGLPYFSVFRMNVDIMLLGCTLDSPTSCFSCEVIADCVLVLLCYCVVYSLYSCISIPFCLSRNFTPLLPFFSNKSEDCFKILQSPLVFWALERKVWYDSGRRPSEPMLRVHASMRPPSAPSPSARRTTWRLPRRNFSSQMIPPPPGDPAKNPYTTSGEPKGTTGDHGSITSWKTLGKRRHLSWRVGHWWLRLGYEMRKGSDQGEW